jgi:hypothetical protein
MSSTSRTINKLSYQDYLNLREVDRSAYLNDSSIEDLEKMLKPLFGSEMSSIDDAMMSRIWLLSTDYSEVSSIHIPELMLPNPDCDPSDQDTLIISGMKGKELKGVMHWNYSIRGNCSSGPNNMNPDRVPLKADLLKFVKGYREYLTETDALWYENNRKISGVIEICNLDMASVMVLGHNSKTQSFRVCYGGFSEVVDLNMTYHEHLMRGDVKIKIENLSDKWYQHSLRGIELTEDLVLFNTALMYRFSGLSYMADAFTVKWSFNQMPTVHHSPGFGLDLERFIELCKSSRSVALQDKKVNGMLFGMTDDTTGLPLGFSCKRVETESELRRSTQHPIKCVG